MVCLQEPCPGGGYCKLHPVADTGAGLRSDLPSLEKDVFIFQGAPQALDEDVVQIAALREPFPEIFWCRRPYSLLKDWEILLGEEGW